MANALQTLLTATGLAFSRLGAIDTPSRAAVFFRQLGYTFDPAAFGSALSELSTAAKDSLSAIEALVASEKQTRSARLHE